MTKNIGIVVPLLSDPFFAEIARNFDPHCIDAGYRPTPLSAHGDPKLEDEILDNLRLLTPAGVLLAPFWRASDRSVLEKFCADVPTVIFDRNVGEFGLEFVGSDNVQVTTHITDYLGRTILWRKLHGDGPHGPDGRCWFEHAIRSNMAVHPRGGCCDG